ncbi:MAG: hypothetical protein ACJ785_11890 [Gemmatimonadaceae bacterium]
MTPMHTQIQPQAQNPSQTPAPSPAPAPVLAPASPLTISTVGPDGQTRTITIPRTRSEVEELLSQREELSEQLTNVASRRRSLAEEIRNTRDASTRTGLEDRLRVLDQRILQLETDLGTTGRQISSAPAELTASAESRNPPASGDDFDEGVMAGGFSVLLFMSVVLFFARRRWKRSPRTLPSSMESESAQRLERLEHGIDAIAIEIERVTEGQRFVTKLLSESQAPLGVPHRIAPGDAETEGSSKRRPS